MAFIVSTVPAFRSFGRGEDGQDLIADVIYVQVQNSKGQRWVHVHSFPTAERIYDEEDGFMTLRSIDGAALKADRLMHAVARSLAKGGKLDEKHWNETFPVYGSEEYQAQDAFGLHREWEEQIERDRF